MCFPLLLLNSECSPICSLHNLRRSVTRTGHSVRWGVFWKAFHQSPTPHQTHLRTNECPQWKTICSPLGCIPLVTTQRTRNCTGLLNNAVQPPSGMSCLHCPKCRGGRSYAENNNGSIIQFEICAFCEYQFVLNGNEQKLGSSELTELYDHNNITITVLCRIVMQLNLAIVCDFMKCAGQLVKAP